MTPQQIEKCIKYLESKKENYFAGEILKRITSSKNDGEKIYIIKKNINPKILNNILYGDSK